MGAVGNGRGGEKESQGWLSGFTWRHTVVVAGIAYAAIIALLVGKNFKNSDPTSVLHNQDLLRNLHVQKVANTLTKDETFKSVSTDNAVNSSGLQLGSITDTDDFLAELRNTLFHSSLVFDLNYNEMMSKFKVFIYPSDDHSFKAFSGEDETAKDLQNTDDLFAYQLYHSDFVTLDAEKAHLLVLPLSIRALVDDSDVGAAKVGKFLNTYVQSLRDDYPYWARALGADHVVVACHEAKQDGSRNCLELRKNAIQVTCSPLADAGSQSFYTHKDVAMPLFQEALLRPTTVDVDLDGERSTLLYYNGPTDPTSSYALLSVSTWETDSSFVFEAPDVDPAVHRKRLSTSKFYLILGSDDYPNIVNALSFGCVPVLVSDGRLYDLPFQDILNWKQFAVVVSVGNVEKMKTLLSAVDEQQYLTMQFLAREASNHLQWHDPPQEQDAFFMVLYDLWIRRHAIRYVRRREEGVVGTEN